MTASVQYQWYRLQLRFRSHSTVAFSNNISEEFADGVLEIKDCERLCCRKKRSRRHDVKLISDEFTINLRLTRTIRHLCATEASAVSIRHARATDASCHWQSLQLDTTDVTRTCYVTGTHSHVTQLFPHIARHQMRVCFVERNVMAAVSQPADRPSGRAEGRKEGAVQLNGRGQRDQL